MVRCESGSPRNTLEDTNTSMPSRPGSAPERREFRAELDESVVRYAKIGQFQECVDGDHILLHVIVQDEEERTEDLPNGERLWNYRGVLANVLRTD